MKLKIKEGGRIALPTPNLNFLLKTAFCTELKNNIEDTKILQKDLEALSKWEADWKMSFHPEKCQVISFKTNRTKILNNNISIEA